jgi:DNA (cytosine-5)-methyltransferase 1
VTKTSVVDAVDMFCGAGGTSSGLLDACRAMNITLNLIAINHWQVAIDTHRANHQYAQHLCTAVDDLNPRKLVPSGRLHVLVASPECTHHSNARGGKPMSDQSRATAWHVLRWAEALYIENILVENVKEFRSWGPLGANGRPIRRLRGQLYVTFINSLKALGYQVQDRVLNAANYGDPTTRERLFIIARRGNRRIVWPVATHASAAKLNVKSQQQMFSGKLQPWRTAREIIDWSIPAQSIFTRKRALAPKTLARIAAGLRKFGGAHAEPFLIVLRRHADAQGLDIPLPTITAKGNHIGLCEPFLLGQQSCGAPRAIGEPCPTVATDGAIALVEPFITNFRGNHAGRQDGSARNHSLDEPLHTLDCSQRYGIVEPFLLNIDHQTHGDSVRSVDSPVPTVTTKARTCLVEPFLTSFYGKGVGRSVDEPVPTVTAGPGHVGLVEPFLIDVNHGDDAKSGRGSRCQPLSDPLSTVTTKRAKALVDPFLVKYNGTAKAQSVDQPLDTVSTKDRFGLVETESGTMRLDIRFRMLEPHELAAAQGLAGYKFTGKKTEVVKQIGNAVPRGLATALCSELIV